MATCESASAVDPDDPYEPEDCGSGFEFPDDEGLVQPGVREEHLVPRGRGGSRRRDPDDPVSVVGLDQPKTSWSTRSRSPTATLRLWPSRRSGRFCVIAADGVPDQRRPVRQRATVREMAGRRALRLPERRLLRRGTGAEHQGPPRPATSVEVWFVGRLPWPAKACDRSESEHFSYTVTPGHGQRCARHRQRGLRGRQPRYPAERDSAKVPRRHVDALDDNGLTADLMGRRRPGRAPRLGVLSHYDAVHVVPG